MSFYFPSLNREPFSSQILNEFDFIDIDALSSIAYTAAESSRHKSDLDGEYEEINSFYSQRAWKCHILSSISIYRHSRLLIIESNLELLPNNKFSLVSSESLFLNKYSNIVRRYWQSVSINITFNNIPKLPPKSVFVQIRIVTDCGTIQTEDGFISLSKNSIHFIRRCFIEHLIKKRFVIVVK